MSIERVTPDQARQRAEEGFRFLDVRSVREFDAGHIPGAVNIPLLDFPPGGMSMMTNPKFLSAVRAIFEPDTQLVTVCAAGRRSLMAADAMANVGFTAVIDLIGGMGGSRTNPAAEPGWVAEGYPVTSDAAPEETWATIEASVD